MVTGTEGHLNSISLRIFATEGLARAATAHGHAAPPRQSSASGREIAARGRLAGHIGLVFDIGPAGSLCSVSNSECAAGTGTQGSGPIEWEVGEAESQTQFFKFFSP